MNNMAQGEIVRENLTIHMTGKLGMEFVLQPSSMPYALIHYSKARRSLTRRVFTP